MQQNKTEILLDSLCVTASTLRYIISPFSWEPYSDNLYLRMLEGAVSTIRRIINVNDKQVYCYPREQGTDMEKIIVENHFDDEARFLTQVKAENVIEVQGVPVKFRGTLDVYDTEEHRITEIKYAVRAYPKNLDGSAIPQERLGALSIQQWNAWAIDYCKKYDVQAQVQMLAMNCGKLNFFIRSKVAEWVMESPNFLVSNWKKDEQFLEKSGDIILQYWKMLNEKYEQFLQETKQIMVYVYTGTDNEHKVEDLLGEEMRNLIHKYVELYEEKSAIERELEQVKKSIEAEASYNELTVFKFNGVSVKKTEPSVTYSYAKIVKDKRILDSLTEEEKIFYSQSKSGGYTIRYTPPKEGSFDKTVNEMMD